MVSVEDLTFSCRLMATSRLVMLARLDVGRLIGVEDTELAIEQLDEAGSEIVRLLFVL